MYVTRTLTSLLRNPETLSKSPPTGPLSGVLVILDREFIQQNHGRVDTSRGGTSINYLPFPQNRLIEIAEHLSESSTYTPVMMIPVVDRPLSSHTYYVIQATEKYSGLVIECSTEEDIVYDCCCGPTQIQKAAKPKQFDPNNLCQQVMILKSDKAPVRYRAQSLAYDALVPHFMSRPNWHSTRAITPSWNCNLNEADGQGMRERLRNCLPDFNFSVRRKSSDNVVVGSWYVPFIFVKEFGMRYKELMRRSMYYTMSLEQRWERVFEAENAGRELVDVMVDVSVKSEVVMLGGTVAVCGGGVVVDGVMRFESTQPGVRGIGLSVGAVERMKWEQARAGWTDFGGTKDQRVEEEHVGKRGWRRFGCYVLVERFLLKRGWELGTEL